MAIPLARRSDGSTPVAVDDDTHLILAVDPTIIQFQPGSTYPNNQYGYNQSGATTNMNQSVSSTPVLTGAATANAMSESETVVKADDHWVNKHWRPAMAYLYMTTCAFDFILFPIGWSVLQALTHGQVTSQWQPLTLQGAGLYHMAMGTVLGVAAYGRTKEKMSGTL